MSDSNGPQVLILAGSDSDRGVVEKAEKVLRDAGVAFEFEIASAHRSPDRVAELAKKHGVPRTQIALAWLLQKQPVTAPIIGATKITHLEEAVGALAVKLTSEEVTYLEEPYVPHRIIGHQ